MKRCLCPSHAHVLKDKKRPISLGGQDLCTVCRWEKRPYTLADIALELELIAYAMRFAHEDPYYDPFGYTFAPDFENMMENWIKTIHKDYAKNLIDRLNKAYENKLEVKNGN